MWLKVGILLTLFTYLYWAMAVMRRRRQKRGCGGDCAHCPKKPGDDLK